MVRKTVGARPALAPDLVAGGTVVGYAAPPEHAFGPALQALAAALAE